MKPDYWNRAKRSLARRDPVMGAIMRAHPKIFLVPRGEPFFTLVRAICGQQISVKAAQSVWNRVCGCLNQKITPQAVVACERKALRACGRYRKPQHRKGQQHALPHVPLARL